jgi:cytochrome c oxidase subunit 3
VVSETHAPAPAAPEHAVEHDGHNGHVHDPRVQHQFDDYEQQRECFSLGMWLFLATEVMMFGGLFFAYSLYRGYFPDAFTEGSSHLMIEWGTANTFVLLTSSLTMALAVHAAGVGDRKRLVRNLTLTWLLGAAFIGVKAIEWGVDYYEGLIPGVAWFYYDNPEHLSKLAPGVTPQNVLMYFVIYFSMTGLHAIHMIVGLALVGYFIFLAQRGHFTRGGNDQPVEILGLYWHLVDIIWVFLFPLLYLIPGFPLFEWLRGGGGGGGH